MRGPELGERHRLHRSALFPELHANDVQRRRRQPVRLPIRRSLDRLRPRQLTQLGLLPSGHLHGRGRLSRLDLRARPSVSATAVVDQFPSSDTGVDRRVVAIHRGLALLRTVAIHHGRQQRHHQRYHQRYRSAYLHEKTEVRRQHWSHGVSQSSRRRPRLNPYGVRSSAVAASVSATRLAEKKINRLLLSTYEYSVPKVERFKRIIHSEFLFCLIDILCRNCMQFKYDFYKFTHFISPQIFIPAILRKLFTNRNTKIYFVSGLWSVNCFNCFNINKSRC